METMAQLTEHHNIVVLMGFGGMAGSPFAVNAIESLSSCQFSILRAFAPHPRSPRRPAPFLHFIHCESANCKPVGSGWRLKMLTI